MDHTNHIDVTAAAAQGTTSTTVSMALLNRMLEMSAEGASCSDAREQLPLHIGGSALMIA